MEIPRERRNDHYITDIEMFSANPKNLNHWYWTLEIQSSRQEMLNMQYMSNLNGPCQFHSNWALVKEKCKHKYFKIATFSHTITKGEEANDHNETLTIAELLYKNNGIEPKDCTESLKMMLYVMHVRNDKIHAKPLHGKLTNLRYTFDMALGEENTHSDQRPDNLHCQFNHFHVSCRSLVFSGTVHWFVGRQAFIHYCGLHQVWREPGN